MKKTAWTWLAVTAWLVLASCSGTQASVTTEAQPPTSLVVEQIASPPLPPPDLSADLIGEELMVAIEARWMCDVQRFAFSDLTAMNEALVERLHSRGLEKTDYDAFKEELENRIELRDQVLIEYEKYCGDD